MNLPNDIEYIIYRYCHEMNLSELKKEFLKNHKLSFIYMIKWRGNCKLEDYYKDIKHIETHISCVYIKKKLMKKLNSLIE